MKRGRLGKDYGSLDPISDRVLMLGAYIAASGATVRDAAKRFGVSKSTVHKDMTERLRNIDRTLFLRVRRVLDCNREQRHIRGGSATREKYLNRKPS
ncbi:MAG TPA: sporulation transcriptional regulator SpoIIID [Oscillospiraceae bacterium]|nr:sporulation transcriptional regulator SpoIIID [Oscillospiraceae bacterium]HPS34207.1 sporulation transcriptional regulator SpoIIID [Oscillospiraceae bacterium]